MYIYLSLHLVYGPDEMGLCDIVGRDSVLHMRQLAARRYYRQCAACISTLHSSVFGLDALAWSVIATATWLGGSVAVTLRYCIKTAKPIGKLFRPSESLIILVF